MKSVTGQFDCARLSLNIGYSVSDSHDITPYTVTTVKDYPIPYSFTCGWRTNNNITQLDHLTIIIFSANCHLFFQNHTISCSQCSSCLFLYKAVTVISRYLCCISINCIHLTVCPQGAYTYIFYINHLIPFPGCHGNANTSENNLFTLFGFLYVMPGSQTKSWLNIWILYASWCIALRDSAVI